MISWKFSAKICIYIQCFYRRLHKYIPCDAYRLASTTTYRLSRIQKCLHWKLTIMSKLYEHQTTSTSPKSCSFSKCSLYPLRTSWNRFQPSSTPPLTHVCYNFLDWHSSILQLWRYNLRPVLCSHLHHNPSSAFSVFMTFDRFVSSRVFAIRKSVICAWSSLSSPLQTHFGISVVSLVLC